MERNLETYRLEATPNSGGSMTHDQHHKPDTDDQYLDHKGTRCPYSHLTAIESADNIETQAFNETLLPFFCWTCRKKWLAIYKLTGWTPSP